MHLSRSKNWLFSSTKKENRPPHILSFCKEKCLQTTLCNTAYCEKATAWQSASSAGNSATGSVYTQLRDSCFLEFTAAYGAEEKDVTDCAGGDGEQIDLALPLCFKLPFLMAMQYIRLWMGIINLNYYFILYLTANSRSAGQHQSNPLRISI